LTIGILYFLSSILCMVMVLIKVSPNYIFILISKVYYFETARTVTIQMCVRVYIEMTRLFLVLLCLLCTSCYNNIHGQRGVEKLFNSLLPAVERSYHYYDIMWLKNVGKMVRKNILFIYLFIFFLSSCDWKLNIKSKSMKYYIVSWNETGLQYWLNKCRTIVYY